MKHKEFKLVSPSENHHISATIWLRQGRNSFMFYNGRQETVTMKKLFWKNEKPLFVTFTKSYNLCFKQEKSYFFSFLRVVEDI